MKALKIALLAVGIIVGINLAVTAINIAQKGGSYKGKSPVEILGKDPAAVTVEDVLKLSKADFVQLFYAVSAPGIDDLQGEYIAQNHPGGIMAPAVQAYTDNFFGPGKWTGKAFRAVDKIRGEGYNIFVAEKDGQKTLVRTRKIATLIGPSEYDGKNSYKLNYSLYNGGLVHSMRDELRKLNDSVYIGLGCMGLGGGAINPSLFIISGKPEPWVGADK